MAGVAETDGGNNYFLNARDTSGEAHEVYKTDYEVMLPVAANSKVTFEAYDQNCIQIMNNAETVQPKGSGTGPNGALVIDALQATMPPPRDFTQPLSNDGRTGQWIYLDVVKVEARP